ncbi:hypothetical protein [Paraburkholderia graminis]
MNRLAYEMQTGSDVLRRERAARLELDDDYLHWRRVAPRNLVRTDPLLSMSEPPVLAELKTKPELICDTRT